MRHFLSIGSLVGICAAVDMVAIQYKNGSGEFIVPWDEGSSSTVGG